MTPKIYITLFLLLQITAPIHSSKPTECTLMQSLTIIEHANPDLNDEYIIGCQVGVQEIAVGVFNVIDQKPALRLELKISTSAITDFGEFMQQLLDHLKEKYNISIKRACIGAPGNTVPNKDFIKFLHLTFPIDAQAIKQKTDLTDILVVNDFEVIGFGIQALDQNITLNEGVHREHATKAIVGAGGGLGSGLLIWDTGTKTYLSHPLSFSFTDFSPQSSLELELNAHFQNELGSHSWGKVLGTAGGLLKIYDFLTSKQQRTTQPNSYKSQQEIFAHRSTDTQCKQAVDLYMKLYTRLIRNVALTLLPYGGLYITNTVAENNPELFQDQTFNAELFDTGNEYLTNALKEIPIYLVPNPLVKIYGAAQYLLVYS